MPDLSRFALQAVDDATSNRVVVYGSQPPDGRDLDLIVHDGDLAAVEAGLAGIGAQPRGNKWAIFREGTAYLVELSPASRWRLPEEELAALFDESEPLNGFRHIAKPAPQHTLLLLARTGVSSKRRSRLRDALGAPGAKEYAEAHAKAWCVDLRTLGVVNGSAPHRTLPASGAVAARMSRPQIVAFSGLDGAGKSTQVRMLASALGALGYRVSIEWSPILGNRSISLLSAAAWGFLRLTRSPEGRAGRSLVAGTRSTSYRRRALKQLWTAYVASVNSLALRRASLVSRGREHIVIYDRFVLDSVVRVRFLYGGREPFRAQRAILDAVAPTPTAAFWLDVPPERAYARKPEHWNVADLTAQHAFYEAEHLKLGVERLDGERPAQELAAEIATRVWQRLELI